FQRLFFVLKRLHKWDDACEIWRIMMQTTPGSSGVFAHVELAKYYEHRKQNFDEAKQLVKAALEHLPRCYPIQVGIREELEYRLRRIERKKRSKESK
ncbi:hypothetical protein K8T06_04660, partial [bacterium]|nr:hypothetical protein [bacterium]